MNTRTKIAAALLATLAMALPAAATTHFISQSDFTWSPDVVVINVGDTVVWQWNSFSHTVTNGTGLADPNVGLIFDAPLNSFSPTFSHTFTAPGTVPFFCRPHLVMGMTGSVVVQDVAGVDQVPAHGPLALASAPNPFNPRTVISFVLPAAASVSVSVHDAAGRLVRMLEQGATLAAGRHETTWDGRGDDSRAVPAGVYVATVEAGEARETVKLTLAK